MYQKKDKKPNRNTYIQPGGGLMTTKFNVMNERETGTEEKKSGDQSKIFTGNVKINVKFLILLICCVRVQYTFFHSQHIYTHRTSFQAVLCVLCMFVCEIKQCIWQNNNTNYILHG